MTIEPSIVIGPQGKILKKKRVDIWVKGETGNDTFSGLSEALAVKTRGRAANIVSGVASEDVQWIIVHLRETITLADDENNFQIECLRERAVPTIIIFDGGPDVVQVFPEMGDLTATTAGGALDEVMDLLNDIKAMYEAHRVLTAGGVHGAADETNVIEADNAVDLGTAMALANDLRAKYEAHRVLTAGSVHGAADATNVVAAPTCNGLLLLLNLANDLRDQYEAHRVLTAGSVHGAADNTNSVTEVAADKEKARAGAFLTVAAAGWDVAQHRGYWARITSGPLSGRRFAVRKSTADTIYLLDTGPSHIVGLADGVTFHLESPATRLASAWGTQNFGGDLRGRGQLYVQNLRLEGPVVPDFGADDVGAEVYYSHLLLDSDPFRVFGVLQRDQSSQTGIVSQLWDVTPETPVEIDPTVGGDIGLTVVGDTILHAIIFYNAGGYIRACVAPQFLGVNAQIESLSNAFEHARLIGVNSSFVHEFSGLDDGVENRFGGFRLSDDPLTPVYPAIVAEQSLLGIHGAICEDSTHGLHLTKNSSAVVRALWGENQLTGLWGRGKSCCDQYRSQGDIANCEVWGGGMTPVEISENGSTEISKWATIDITPVSTTELSAGAHDGFGVYGWYNPEE